MVPKSLLLASVLALPTMSRPLSPLIYDGENNSNGAAGNEGAALASPRTPRTPLSAMMLVPSSSTSTSPSVALFPGGADEGGFAASAAAAVPAEGLEEAKDVGGIEANDADSHGEAGLGRRWFWGGHWGKWGHMKCGHKKHKKCKKGGCHKKEKPKPAPVPVPVPAPAPVPMQPQPMQPQPIIVPIPMPEQPKPVIVPEQPRPAPEKPKPKPAPPKEGGWGPHEGGGGGGGYPGGWGGGGGGAPAGPAGGAGGAAGTGPSGPSGPAGPGGFRPPCEKGKPCYTNIAGAYVPDEAADPLVSRDNDPSPAPVDQPPVDQPPIDQLPVDQLPVDQPPPETEVTEPVEPEGDIVGNEEGNGVWVRAAGDPDADALNDGKEEGRPELEARQTEEQQGENEGAEEADQEEGDAAAADGGEEAGLETRDAAHELNARHHRGMQEDAGEEEDDWEDWDE